MKGNVDDEGSVGDPHSSGTGRPSRRGGSGPHLNV